MQLIPRLFHRIWLGGRPMPDDLQAYGESWLLHHPRWAMKLWTERNLPSLINRECLQLARNYSQASDVIRYELVSQFGGVYLDVDFVCQKNIEPLLDDLTFFAASERPGVVSAGIFGATARHPLVEDVIREVPRRIRMEGYQSITTGPGMLTAVWERHRNSPGLHIYDAPLFYPYPWNQKHRRSEPFPEAYAVHHWHGSWITDKDGGRPSGQGTDEGRLPSQRRPNAGSDSPLPQAGSRLDQRGSVQ